jgi:hypothetical protein
MLTAENDVRHCKEQRDNNTQDMIIRDGKFIS